MSIIASNSRNSFGKTIDKMYTGSDGMARAVSPTNATDSVHQKLGWLFDNVGGMTQRDIISSGAGGRSFGIDVLPAVRKKTAKDYI